LSDGSWANPIRIPVARAAERLDHAFHDACRAGVGVGASTLRDLGVAIVRGRASSTKVRAGGGAYFHTDRFPTQVGGAVALLEGGVGHENEILATVGDILLARVDRRLEEKVAFVVRGSAPISDCVFRLRCDRSVAERVLRGLTGPAGRAQLQARARGVGARSLTMDSVLDIIV
jgi:type I restriction enzyme M protein